jgi:hypothetical protein
VLLIFGCSENDSSSGPALQGEDEQGILTSITDEEGITLIEDAEGEILLEAEVLDFDGNPLPNLDATYLACSPHPLVCFNDAESGDAAGTFLLVPQETSAQGGFKTPAADGHSTAIFILHLLDPTLGRLYDPLRDGFSPTRYPNLDSIRKVVSLDEIMYVLEFTPGVEDLGIVTRGELMGIFDSERNIRYFDECIDNDPSEGANVIAHRVGLFSLFAANQDNSYRYRRYRSTHTETRFLLPLGVSATVTIDNPTDGETFTDPADQIQHVTGTIGCPPEVLTQNGGRVEFSWDGAAMSDNLLVTGDGTGNGSEFATDAPLELAEGENTFQVTAYVSEVNRGLETAADGVAGQAAVTVNYEGIDAGAHAPALTGLNHPTEFSCPDGTVPISFHFSDPDGDVVTAYEALTWHVNGESGSLEGSVPVDEETNLECLRGTEADCTLTLSYTGLHAGDWFRWEFWVEDAEGLVSEKLDVLVTITGCPLLRAGQPAICSPLQVPLLR